ncbi:MAG TPA: GspE/PulE family protein [Terriglobia bacterium]|nr:GspE/PulE family protein [Terriglobia bacterium]
MSRLPVLAERPRSLDLEPVTDVSPVIRIQQMIFREAQVLGASDIHIEPGREGTRVRYRVNGLMKETMALPRWMHEKLVVRIKILANLDITEKRAPQDGHIGHSAESADDIRVSALPTRWGEKIVLRVLRRDRAVMTIAQLGFPADLEERLHALIRRPQGIFLVVGPTGSGKTTTLYGLIHEIRGEPLNIVTIEDPIEYEVDGITQVQLQEKAGLTFPRALRSILRQDPDVILLGEIRDAETARTAFHAAMTGHLVLSTLHCPDTISTFLRLGELGIERPLAANSILGVLAQRLVRFNCPTCRTPEEPRPVLLERLKIAPEHRDRLRIGAGCPECRFTGSSGRAGLYELLEMGASLREAALSGNDERLRETALETGLRTLDEQARAMALEAKISAREAYRSGHFAGV